MPSATDCVALVRRAQQNAARAAGEWTPVDAVRIAECVTTLECAALDLRTVMESFDPGAPADYGQMRADLLALKRSLGGLNRLMEASAAFIRNLPGQNSRMGQTYGAGGHLSAFTAPPASSVEA